MARKKTKRDDDLSRRPAIRKRLIEVYTDVEQGYLEQSQRSDSIQDNWDAYNCVLGPKQFYNGTAQFYVPLIHDAVEARVTRFTNQLYPQTGRYVEVTAVEEQHPNAIMALLEHYVDRCKLRTELTPALLRNGDMEGQYSVYVDWSTVSRTVAQRVVNPLKIHGMEMPTDLYDGVETIEEKKVKESRPDVVLLADPDLLVLPATANSIEDAFEQGGSVTVMRRWTKGKIKKLIEDGDIEKEEGDRLLKEMSNPTKSAGRKDPSKTQADAAGIKIKAGNKHALVYETWTKLKVDGEMRLCRSYYGGEDAILGCKLNPYWCDLCPVLSAPVQKVKGLFKGKPPVDYVLDWQILANDTINEGADTAHYSAMPIVMTDPNKNPRVDTMVLGLAALWQTDPQSTQFAKFPELWKDALDRVGAVKDQVFQTLGVNPSMIPQTSSMKKRNQAEMAMEQQVDLLTTAEACSNVEGSILSPLLQRYADLDHQFRDEAMSVKVYGEMGEAARMEAIDPLQAQDRYIFKWLGVESARNAARLQQQVSAGAMLMKIPPNSYPGYKLNMAPVIVAMVENLWGPRIGRLVLEDQRKQMTVDPELENDMMRDGFLVDVHAGDDDVKHLQSHMQALSGGADPHGTIRTHIQGHQQQMQAKQMAAMQQQMQGPGGGGPKPPGGRGTEPGAQAGTLRGSKGPPGMIHADRMPAAGGLNAPRKM